MLVLPFTPELSFVVALEELEELEELDELVVPVVLVPEVKIEPTGIMRLNRIFKDSTNAGRVA